MKVSKLAVRGKATDSLTLRFESQELTSFAGLMVFARLFAALALKERLRGCFRHLRVMSIYGHHRIMMVLLVHLLLGYRQLRDARYYDDDVMVKRVLGLKRLPDVSTISRTLANADSLSVEKVRQLSRELVLERLKSLNRPVLTLDFDGSVQSTRRHAEGTAVGFNKQKKGARSYYPLLCTVAQTDQVLDVHHRPGNVHDSNGAQAFIEHCGALFNDFRADLVLEARLDSAFFAEPIVESVDDQDIQFSMSVPFERFERLKQQIAAQRQWWATREADVDAFELLWKPESWVRAFRFVCVRQRVKVQRKAPVQLDLFELDDFEFQYKVIVTNRDDGLSELLRFHEGRGSQEGVFAELKSHCQMDYVPVRTQVGNQLFLLANILTHNLARELQMRVDAPLEQRLDCPKRASLWRFQELATLRRNFIQRAGRLIRPSGRPTLSVQNNDAVRRDLIHYLDGLERRAA